METMIGIEYNVWMSLIAFIKSKMQDMASDYGLSGVNITISSAYPKDLTKFNKPSIIIQKINSDKFPVGFGSVLGNYYSESDNADYDVSGEIYNINFQISVIDSTNTRCLLITSALEDGVLSRAYHRIKKIKIPLSNYITDVNNPTEIGTMDIVDYVDAMQLASNENEDYISAVRVELGVIRHIIDMEDMIDLSKPIHITQDIKL